MKIQKIYNRYQLIIHNFSYMTLLRGVTVILPLVTFPYLLKTLGTEKYGLLMWAWAIAQIFIAFVKYGFDTLGVKLISENRNEHDIISSIVAKITLAKLFLFLTATIIILILLQFEKFHSNSELFSIFIAFIFFESMFPVWYFQGIEKMKYIAILTSLTKIFFALSVFLFVNNETDYLFVPFLYSIGSGISLLLSVFVISKEKITFVKVNMIEVLSIVKESSLIFSASIGTVLRDKLTITLIELYVGLEGVAFFDLTSKVVNVILTPFHIFSNVTYPYIAKSRDVAYISKSVVFLVFFSAIIVAFLFINADIILELLLDNRDYLLVEVFSIVIFILPPGILSSFISTNILIVFGSSKYYFIATAMAFSLCTAIFILLNAIGEMNLMSFAVMYLIYFLVEFVVFAKRSYTIIERVK